MSLVAFALRFSAVQAIIAAQTFAGADNVFDSTSIPVGAGAPNAAPFVVISTGHREGKPSGRDVLTSGTHDFLVEYGIPSTFPVDTGERNGDAPVMAELTARDGNIEFLLAVFQRQIAAALWGRAGGNWSAVFQSLVSSISDFGDRGTISRVDGAEFTARQALYVVSTVAEPAFATPLASRAPLNGFYEALLAVPEMAVIAKIFAFSVTGKTAAWPEIWTREAACAGLTEREAELMRLAAPFGIGKGGVLSEVHTDMPGVSVTAEVIADHSGTDDEP